MDVYCRVAISISAGRADQEHDRRCARVSHTSRTCSPKPPHACWQQLYYCIDSRHTSIVVLPRLKHVLLRMVEDVTTIQSTLPPSHPTVTCFFFSAICWWTLGHGFAYGTDSGGFVGTDHFVFSGSQFGDDVEGAALSQWFFQWAFAGERCCGVMSRVGLCSSLASVAVLHITNAYYLNHDEDMCLNGTA